MATRQELASGLARQEVLSVLRYDAESGKFYWLVDRHCGTNHRVQCRAGDEAGSTTSSGYRVITLNYFRLYAHRLAWLIVYGMWPEGRLDHRDLDRQNNRIDNLREATNGQNMANTRGRAKSGFKGVVIPRHAPNSYIAQITIDGRPRYLGCFRTAEEAHAAYVMAAVKRHGEFARAG